MRIVYSVIFVVILICLLVVYFPCKTAASSSFNAITAAKARIPSENRTRMWYVGKWTQKRIAKNVWKVSVSDGVWKVSLDNDLCSETGEYVSICSENGTAKKYSGMGFCKPSYICENRNVNISGGNIPKELTAINLSKLSYSQKEIDGWQCTVVTSIPERVRRAVFFETAKFEQDNPNASSTDTIKAFVEPYGLPEKAEKAIYYEGIFERWQRK